MYPEILSLDLPLLGRVTISSFGVMMALAFLAGWQVIRYQLRERGKDEELAFDILLGAMIGGIVGAKLYYVFQHAAQTPAGFWDLLFQRAGLTWYGGFIGGALGVVWAIRRRGERVGELADVTAPALALSYGIGRVGCFLVGDDYGRPTESWIGIKFPEGAPPTTAGNLRRHFGVTVPEGIPDGAVLAVYPTQLFEVVMALFIFLWLWPRRKHAHADGWLCGVWMILAGLERLVVEIFRAKDDRFFGPFTLAQLLSFALVALGAYLVHRLRAGGRGTASRAAAAGGR